LLLSFGVKMAVVRFRKPRQRRSIRYYLVTDEGPVRMPLRLHRDLVSGEVVMPRFANSLQHFVEVQIEAGPERGRKIHMRSTSTRFDANRRVDLHHAVEAIAVLVEGSKPRPLREKVLDVVPAIRANRLERETTWRAPPSVLRAIRADIEGKNKLPTLSAK
jgi:hypothetical protein